MEARGTTRRRKKKLKIILLLAFQAKSGSMWYTLFHITLYCLIGIFFMLECFKMKICGKFFL